jgi:alkanesulfonate monooxygenase
MLAGGFRSDLLSLNDPTPHDDRYQRMTEYTKIVKLLLESDAAVTFDGEYYQVRNLRLIPSLPPELQPGILVSGSSASGMSAAMELNATAVKYPGPAGKETGNASHESGDCGLRVGIIARDSDEEAWRVARERFPEDRKGQITHELAMKVSDSHWHQQLSSNEADENGGVSQVYWLGPFRNYKTFCPYLVGSYDRVARELAAYGALGYRTVILDIPPNEEELCHTGTVFEAAEALLKT